MFMDRDDILNLFIVNNLPLPNKITKQEIVADDDDMPF